VVVRNAPSREKLTGPHPLILGTRPHFLKTRDPNDFYRHKENDYFYLRPYKRLLADMIVSKASLDAGLNIFSEVLLEMESQGIRVRLASPHEQYQRSSVEIRENTKTGISYDKYWAPARITVADIDTVSIGLTLFELSEQIQIRYVNGNYIPVYEVTQNKIRYSSSSWITTRDEPSGRFCLQAYSPYSGTSWVGRWPINSGKDLSRQGRKIAKELLEHATTVSDQLAEAEIVAEVHRLDREESHRKWELEQKEKKCKQAFVDSQSELSEVIEQWSRMKGIERFFDEIEMAISGVGADQSIALSERVKLARKMIGKSDALEALLSWRTPDERLSRGGKS
jgi:hypothetical protein